MTQETQKNNSAVIIVAIIGIIGTIIATTIGVIGNYNVEKLRQDAELTRIALISTNAQAGSTQASFTNMPFSATSTPMIALANTAISPTNIPPIIVSTSTTSLQTDTPFIVSTSTLPSQSLSVLTNGDIIALKNLGSIGDSRWLQSRAIDNGVDLSSTLSDNTKWQVYEIDNGVIALQSVGEIKAWLNGRTGDGWVNLSIDLNDTGTKWQVFEVGNGIITLKCLGSVEGPRWLDGGTNGNIVGLVNQADQQLNSTWWEIVR